MNTQENTPKIEADEPEIVITISGRAKAGKSTLAMFIAMCLDQVGIDNVAINNEDDDPNALQATFQARLKTLSLRDPQVSIEMAQLPRDRVQLILPPSAQ